MTARRKIDPPINEALSVTVVLPSDPSVPRPANGNLETEESFSMETGAEAALATRPVVCRG
jgi:hypothetical protein